MWRAGEIIQESLDLGDVEKPRIEPELVPVRLRLSPAVRRGTPRRHMGEGVLHEVSCGASPAVVLAFHLLVEEPLFPDDYRMESQRHHYVRGARAFYVPNQSVEDILI